MRIIVGSLPQAIPQPGPFKTQKPGQRKALSSSAVSASGQWQLCMLCMDLM
jgi:hypothetical protein